MNCKDFDQDISAFQDQELDERQQELCAAHVRECPRCTARLAEVRHVDDALRGWPIASEPIWPAFEARVMAEIEHRQNPLPLFSWWAFATAASALAIAVATWALWPSARVGHVMPTAGNTTVVERASPQPLKELSSAEEADARTLYYRGLELYRNGEGEGARALFSEIQERYPGSGLAASAAFYDAWLADKERAPETLDVGVLRARLAVWEGMRLDVLAEEEIERALYFRASMSCALCRKSGLGGDRDRARFFAGEYLRRYPKGAAEVATWLSSLR